MRLISSKLNKFRLRFIFSSLGSAFFRNGKFLIFNDSKPLPTISFANPSNFSFNIKVFLLINEAKNN